MILFYSKEEALNRLEALYFKARNLRNSMLGSLGNMDNTNANPERLAKLAVEHLDVMRRIGEVKTYIFLRYGP